MAHPSTLIQGVVAKSDRPPSPMVFHHKWLLKRFSALVCGHAQFNGLCLSTKDPEWFGETEVSL